MGHEHTHDHGHCHGHSHGGNKKTLAISLAIILLYMLVEVVGGLLTKSLALLADAGHMLSDASKARLLVSKPPTTSTSI